MPGNSNYVKLLNFICPGYNSENIDIDWRTVGLLGMPRSGKTTLAFTIGNDLEARFGEEFIMLYGYWLHKVMEHAVEDRLLEGKRVAFILIEDATGRINNSTARMLLSKDMRTYFEIAHKAREAGLKEYTGWVLVAINFHSYMVLGKYFRNAHAMIVKSWIPKWQRYEHEDITLRWLDKAIVKELTSMRYSSRPELVNSALNKAVMLTITGWSDVIKYEAVKHPPKNYVDLREEVGGEETNDENPDINALMAENQALRKALRRLIDELNLRTKVDKSKYLRVRTKDGRYVSIGPIAHLMNKQN